ncbi:VOC family protein [Mucilaginibacter angelicae]|uniref:VOC family protein n=1 Tax=Mucilaginibacter angelicae TaxID=869718 RepID=A0ABV6L0A6_9SPHI
MKLNHIGFAVTDVMATVELFENYFGLARVPEAPLNAKMGFVIDDDGSLITLFKTNDAVYPKIFHIGFMQGNIDQVYQIHEKLKAGGFDPEDIREEHGRMTFYFKGPGNFVVEVNSLIQDARPELTRAASAN